MLAGNSVAKCSTSIRALLCVEYSFADLTLQYNMVNCVTSLVLLSGCVCGRLARGANSFTIIQRWIEKH